LSYSHRLPDYTTAPRGNGKRGSLQLQERQQSWYPARRAGTPSVTIEAGVRGVGCHIEDHRLLPVHARVVRRRHRVHADHAFMASAVRDCVDGQTLRNERGAEVLEKQLSLWRGVVHHTVSSCILLGNNGNPGVFLRDKHT